MIPRTQKTTKARSNLGWSRRRASDRSRRGSAQTLAGRVNMDEDFAFDRYTKPARLALFYAHTGVSEHGGTGIADAHLLLGILKAAPELGPLMRPSVNIQPLSECLVGAVAAPSLLPTSVELP